MNDEENKKEIKATISFDQIDLKETDNGQVEISLSIGQWRNGKGRFQKIKQPKKQVVRTTNEGTIVIKVFNIVQRHLKDNYWLEIYPNRIYLCLRHEENVKPEVYEQIYSELQKELIRIVYLLEYSSNPSTHINQEGKKAQNVISLQYRKKV